MADSHELGFYSITITNKEKRRRLAIASVQIDGKDIFTILREYFEMRQATGKNDEQNQKLLSIGKLNSNQLSRLIRGIIHTGTYGRKGELINSETGESKEIDYPDATVKPFYFLLSLPAGKAQGIIAFERYQNLGIKEVVQDDLKEYFSNITNDQLNINLKVLSYEALLQQIRNSELKEIRIVKYGLQRDFRNAFLRKRAEPDSAIMEWVVKPAKEEKLSFGKAEIINFIENLKDSEKVVPVNRVLEIDNLEYDTIKVHYEVNGKDRTVNLANPLAGISYFDISEEVEVAEGKTVFRSINGIAEKYIEEFESKLDKDTTDGQT